MTNWELDVVLTKLNLLSSPCQIVNKQYCIFKRLILIVNVNANLYLVLAFLCKKGGNLLFSNEAIFNRQTKKQPLCAVSVRL